MIKVTTERMLIYPISNEEMEIKVKDETDSEMKQAYSEMLAGCREKPDQRVWYAVWIMQLKSSRQIVGDLCFKGLNDNGSVEIGYGIEKKYEGKGLMTEAVTAMAQWASNQLGVSQIEAEIEANNIASQRVLQKAGFLANGIIGKEGPRFTWKNRD